MDQGPGRFFLERGVIILEPGHGLGAFGGLAELEFNGLGPASADRVFRQPLAVLLKIGLRHDLPVAPVIAAEGVHYFVQIGKFRNFSVPHLQRGVLGGRAFADDAADPGHGGPGEIILPVHFQQGGQDHGQGDLDRMPPAQRAFKPDVEDGRLVRSGRDALSPEDAAVDVEVGAIQRIILLRGDLVVARGGGVDALRAQHGGQADLAGAGAVGGAEGAHAALRRQRVAACFGFVEAGGDSGVEGHDAYLLAVGGKGADQTIRHSSGVFSRAEAAPCAGCEAHPEYDGRFRPVVSMVLILRFSRRSVTSFLR